ncbi:MAG TPA: STAS domain-containing protein [Acidimicrobiales bacterium]|jgi:anti-sigma B factor antagonist|nr:STAS domain-containing protein [Acidimicrobiales bacterium]
MDDFRVDIAGDGPVVVARVVGELDAATAPVLDEALRRVEDERQPPELVVDLSAVGFLDSSGLSVLVAHHKRLRVREASFVVASPSSGIRRIFSIAGLDGVLTIR